MLHNVHEKKHHSTPPRIPFCCFATSSYVPRALASLDEIPCGPVNFLTNTLKHTLPKMVPESDPSCSLGFEVVFVVWPHKTRYTHAELGFKSISDTPSNRGFGTTPTCIPKPKHCLVEMAPAAICVKHRAVTFGCGLRSEDLGLGLRIYKRLHSEAAVNTSILPTIMRACVNQDCVNS